MDLSSLPPLLVGLLLGIGHATDADHVVAVTTIVAKERSLARASRIGALWGLGHSTTILLLGGAIVVFRLAIPPRVGLALEFCVAVMLITLGLANLWQARGTHDAARDSAVRPVAVGFVHGLAGSAFVAMLVLGAITDAWQGLLYLVLFGLGTMAGMSLVTLALAVPAGLASARVHGLQRWIRVAAGAASLIFGLALAHELGVEDGLFTANPTWSPK